jgi:DNA-binding HxlR family transcriptional regulator
MASAWLYTEIVEHVKRDAFKVEIIEFMSMIEHDRLLQRVSELEENALIEKHHKEHHPETENGHD